MVMPLYDDNPFKLPQTPVVSWSLIGFTIVAFFLEFSANDNPTRGRQPVRRDSRRRCPATSSFPGATQPAG